MDAYAGQALPKKLGIKSGMKIALVDAPPGFIQLLGPIPEGVQFKDDFAEGCEMAIWFVRSQSDLAHAVHIASGLSTLRSLWFAWPKKASGLPTDLTQQVVREPAWRMIGWIIKSVPSTRPGRACCLPAEKGNFR